MSDSQSKNRLGRFVETVAASETVRAFVPPPLPPEPAIDVLSLLERLSLAERALPDDVKRVNIVAVGRTRIIAPAGEIWDSWFEGADATSDFMSERDQGASQEREAF